ncbi:putative bifunctional diguanylate cyclase/phosphodiesterase [Gandjariella thermophila]|uniref:Signal transduction protein n=1 Tax=Gandjariella thermophila TaxID=1931992 RepID=A0A4D4JCH6_9PSEU|nr:EAL domain-containing protein [Gandjariella thermophila]GDY33314.1 signal transduction protein [Gandjariella thermophila]
MTPPPGVAHEPRDVLRRRRVELAQRWAEAVSGTAYVPMSHAEIENFLLGLIDRLADALSGESVDEEVASGVGALLVEHNFTGTESLRHTLEVLGHALLAEPTALDTPSSADRIVTLLSAIACGYATRTRLLTFDQQEEVKWALLKAKHDVERVLHLTEARFREVFASSALGIAITELDGTCVEANTALAQILGREPNELTGRPLHELFHPDDVDDLRAAYRDLAEGRTERVRERRRLVGEDGETAWVHLAASLLHDADGRPAYHVTMVEDVTELHLLQDRLGHQTLHDPLTGLPNRQYLVSQLETVLGRTDPATRVILYYLGLDAFSVINDGLGYQVGDALLRVVASRLATVVDGEHAMVARVEGDEFAILMENSPSTPDLATLIRRINDELAEPIYLDGHGVAVSASIAAVRRPQHEITPEEMLGAAQATLRRVKANGKRQWGLYDQRRDSEERATFALAAVMPGAWENGDIGVVYRPVVRAADRRIVGVQALLRWDDPERGRLLRHDQCVALAETTGLALPLGQWLLARACEQAAGWRQRLGDDTPPLYVNLPPSLTQDADLIATVTRILDATTMPAGALRLALDTRTVLTETGDATDNLLVLADKGLSPALHGFGGGYRELALLAEMPVRAVAVPAGAVGRPDADSVLGRAVADLVAAAHAAGAEVIAEGVDGDEQAAWWHRVGGDLALGEVFGVDAEPDEVVDLLGSEWTFQPLP